MKKGEGVPPAVRKAPAPVPPLVLPHFALPTRRRGPWAGATEIALTGFRGGLKSIQWGGSRGFISEAMHHALNFVEDRRTSHDV